MVSAALAAMAAPASAAFLTVYGGPTYDQTGQTGYSNPRLVLNPASTVGDGVVVGNVDKYSSGTNFGERAVRWEPLASSPTELGNLGTVNSGATVTQAYAINSIGTAVGYAQKYTGGTDLGWRAVRWEASSSAAAELGNLGTNSSGITKSEAYAINGAGTAVGFADKYTGGTLRGVRAVRWAAGGRAATELGILGTDPSGATESYAYAISSAGTAIGYAEKYTSGTYLGRRAVRWAALGTAATELNNLGTDSFGGTVSQAFRVNTAGAAVGFAWKYTNGQYLGDRAVRWDASGSGVTELGNLGTSSIGNTTSQALAINDDGTAVGFAEKYTSGTYVGVRAVRWETSTTLATELPNLGTQSNGYTSTFAYSLNTSGIVAGYADNYVGGSYVARRAVIWDAAGSVVDLNTLMDPASGWTLIEAGGISDTNWVTGLGLFDPDGPGPMVSYSRLFLLNVSNAIPEPIALPLLELNLTLLPHRRRRFRAKAPVL